MLVVERQSVKRRVLIAVICALAALCVISVPVYADYFSHMLHGYYSVGNGAASWYTIGPAGGLNGYLSIGVQITLAPAVGQANLLARMILPLLGVVFIIYAILKRLANSRGGLTGSLADLLVTVLLIAVGVALVGVIVGIFNG